MQDCLHVHIFIGITLLLFVTKTSDIISIQTFGNSRSTRYVASGGQRGKLGIETDVPDCKLENVGNVTPSELEGVSSSADDWSINRRPSGLKCVNSSVEFLGSTVSLLNSEFRVTNCGV